MDDDAVPPDDKDWTWVLQRRCPECGFDAPSMDVHDIPELVRGNAASWQDVLAGPDVRRRPRPGVWSPLEYGCHVRDVFRLFERRLQLMLAEEDPLFANWDQDATAVAERYGEQDPAVVAAELLEAAEVLASSFAALAEPPVGPPRTAQRRRRVHGPFVRALPRARPRAPPGRRDLKAIT